MSLADKFHLNCYSYKNLFCIADINNEITNDKYGWWCWFIIVLTKEIISENDA